MKLIPIDDRRGLCLTSNWTAPANPNGGWLASYKRSNADYVFANNFKGVFDSLPQSVRDGLLAFWKPKGPRIELVDSLEPLGDGGPVIAHVIEYGHCLQFNAHVTGAMPDIASAALIGHEVAHCWRWAQGIEGRKSSTRGDDERATDDLAESFGYSQAAIVDWHNGITPTNRKRTPAEISAWSGPGGRYSRGARSASSAPSKHERLQQVNARVRELLAKNVERLSPVDWAEFVQLVGHDNCGGERARLESALGMKSKSVA